MPNAITRDDLTVKPLTDTQWKGEVSLVVTPDNEHFVVSAKPFPSFEQTFQETLDEAEHDLNVLFGLSTVEELRDEIRAEKETFRKQYDKVVRGREGETAIFRTDSQGNPLWNDLGDLEQVVVIDGLDTETALLELVKVLNED